MSRLDAVDRELLRLLQQDAEMPMAELAAAVDLSPTPCWRRIQRLKSEKIIARQVVLVDRDKLNVGITAFVSIRVSRHDEEWAQQFHDAVKQIPEVVEFYRMSGEVDYLLRVVLPDIGAYDGLYKRLVRSANLFVVSSSFAMQELKFTTAMPTEHAGRGRARCD